MEGYPPSSLEIVKTRTVGYHGKFCLTSICVCTTTQCYLHQHISPSAVVRLHTSFLKYDMFAQNLSAEHTKNWVLYQPIGGWCHCFGCCMTYALTSLYLLHMHGRGFKNEQNDVQLIVICGTFWLRGAKSGEILIILDPNSAHIFSRCHSPAFKRVYYSSFGLK